jgi:hypothetical protein
MRVGGAKARRHLPPAAGIAPHYPSAPRNKAFGMSNVMHNYERHLYNVAEWLNEMVLTKRVQIQNTPNGDRYFVPYDDMVHNFGEENLELMEKVQMLHRQNDLYEINFPVVRQWLSHSVASTYMPSGGFLPSAAQDFHHFWQLANQSNLRLGPSTSGTGY